MEEKKDVLANVASNEVDSILKAIEEEKLPRKETQTDSQSVASELPVDQVKQAPVQPKTPSTSRDFLPKQFRKGDIIKVTVVKIEPNGIMVSAGGKEDVFIPTHGLSNKEISRPEEVVHIGDKIDVLVMKDGGSGSGAVLSKKMADYIKQWNNLKEKFNNGEAVKGKIVKQIKGGLLVDIDGITAFLPQSQIGLKKGEHVEDFVGKELDLHIIELDKAIKRAVVSRIKILEALKEQKRKEALVSLRKGEIYDGIVRSIQDFGVFVELGEGIEGLVRVNELTWGRRKTPRELLRVGESVKVKVIGINLDTGKVLLSLRQTKPYPWDVVEEKFPVNSVVEGVVIRIHPFGAVLELDDGLTGLVHISQLDKKRVNKVEEIANIGDKMQVKVMGIDKENKKIKLSRRALLEDEHEHEDD
ncbi:MAG: 30S ribosomal protein S1 [Caldisericaceae bacterium]